MAALLPVVLETACVSPLLARMDVDRWIERLCSKTCAASLSEQRIGLEDVALYLLARDRRGILWLSAYHLRPDLADDLAGEVRRGRLEAHLRFDEADIEQESESVRLLTRAGVDATFGASHVKLIIWQSEVERRVVLSSTDRPSSSFEWWWTSTEAAVVDACLAWWHSPARLPGAHRALVDRISARWVGQDETYRQRPLLHLEDRIPDLSTIDWLTIAEDTSSIGMAIGIAQAMGGRATAQIVTWRPSMVAMTAWQLAQQVGVFEALELVADLATNRIHTDQNLAYLERGEWRWPWSLRPVHGKGVILTPQPEVNSGASVLLSSGNFQTWNRRSEAYIHITSPAVVEMWRDWWGRA